MFKNRQGRIWSTLRSGRRKTGVPRTPCALQCSPCGYRFYRPVRSQSGFLRNPIAPASRVWSITLPAVNYSSSGNNNRYPFFFPSSFCYNCLLLHFSDRVPVRSVCYIILFSKPVTGIEPVSTAWKAAMRSEFLTEFLSHLLRRFEVPFTTRTLGR